MKHIPRIFIQNDFAKENYLELIHNQFHHIVNVLRSKCGEIVHVFNQESGEFSAIIQKINKDSITLKINQKIKDSTQTCGPTLIFPILSHTKIAFIVEKSTELGVTQLIPVITQYSQRQHFNLSKYEQIAIQSTEQCGRLSLPKIHIPAKLQNLLQHWPENKIIFVGDNTTPLSQKLSNSLTNTAVFLIGPEGGFSSQESALFDSYKFIKKVKLGHYTMRSETACIAFLATLLKMD